MLNDCGEDYPFFNGSKSITLLVLFLHLLLTATTRMKKCFFNFVPRVSKMRDPGNEVDVSFPPAHKDML